MKAIIGKKVGMSQIFDENGKVIPVTVIEAGPCVVVQKKTSEKEGYEAVQLGFEDVPERKLTKPEMGHLSKAGVAPKKYLREFNLDNAAELNVGDLVKADTFKEGDFVEITEDEGELNDWLSTIKEILDDPQPDAMDFLDAIKLNLFASEIFVFTPKGEIKTMPAGCTALDFAFQIHTFLGSHCIGAKVNHKLVPLSHKLQSGDQVEILTSKSQHVDASWINFVSTAKARSKIQSILRRNGREIQKQGEEILTEFLQRHDMELTSSVLDKLCAYHEIQKHESLFLALGEKKIILGDKDIDELLGKKKSSSTIGWRRYVPFIKKDKKKAETPHEAGNELFVVPQGFNKKKPIYISEDNIHQYLFPDCCHPIPGDDILGYIDGKNHIEIHKRACSVASKLKSSYGNRIVDAKWDMHKQLFFDATIQINGIDRKGMLKDVAEVITDEFNIDMRHISISSNEGIFTGTIDMRVYDRENVKTIIEKLKKVANMQEVQQIL